MQPNPIVEIARPNADPIKFGNDQPLVMISGPCQLESREHGLEVSAALKEISDKTGVPIIYKTSFDKANRTSLSGKRGIGLEAALPIFAEIRETTGMPVLTDVHTAEQCAMVADAVDVLQIPAFLCRQTDLLIAAAETGKPINVKKGQFLAPWDMANVINKVTGAGNPNVFACERGASFGYNALVVDMRGIPTMKAMGCPVVLDATHSTQQPGGQGTASGGQREFAPYLARAAVSLGIAAVFAETHPDPANAPSDGPVQIPLDRYEEVVLDLKSFDELAKSRLVPQL